jgi:hypothetical protein
MHRMEMLSGRKRLLGMREKMNRNDVMIRTVIVSIILGIVLVTSGCIVVQPSNATAQQTLPPVSHTTLSTPQQFPTSVPPTQNQIKITPVTVVTAVTPHFTGTVTYGSNKLTYGSNQSPPMTEDQAWKYAGLYLAKYGMQDFHPAEIIPLGQGKYTYENGTQTWTWGFHVRRCTEGVGCYGLAIITIDANDGHMLDIIFLD